jgi:predicted transcriptional regulator of viral defense system
MTSKVRSRPSTGEFLLAHPVFSVAEAVRAFGPAGGKRRMRKRLRYHVAKGRLRSVAHGVYAAIPPGVAAGRFQPDRYLVAQAVRPDGVLAYHAALELLGAAHSDWGVCSVLTAKLRAPLELGTVRIVFLPHPQALRRRRAQMLGIRTVDRRGRSLRVTGPERTLLDGLRHPDRLGGLEELVESAAGFGVLDLTLLHRLLEAYGEKRLWAAAGWFLERHQQRFFVPPEYLAAVERRRPAGPRYLARGRRGGKLCARWNLVVPEALAGTAEPDDA